MLEKHHPCLACFHLSTRHCFGHQGETECWVYPARLPTCSLTFAAPGCQQPRCLPKIIGDLDISSKHDDRFDHIQVVMLGDKRKLSQEPRSAWLHHVSFPPSSFISQSTHKGSSHERLQLGFQRSLSLPRPFKKNLSLLPSSLCRKLTFMARCSGVLPS